MHDKSQTYSGKIKNNDGHYTEEFKKYVLEQLESNTNIHELAESNGMHPATLYKWIKKYFPGEYYKFVKQKSRGIIMSELSLKLVKEESGKGKTYQEIAKENGIKAGSLASAVSILSRIEKAREEGVYAERQRIQKKLEKLKRMFPSIIKYISQELFCSNL